MAGSRSQLKLSRDEVKEILEEHDVDGDGTLTKQEVMQALNSMGAELSFQKAHYGVSHADQDGDGRIDLEDAEMEKLVDYVMRFQASRIPNLSPQKQQDAKSTIDHSMARSRSQLNLTRDEVKETLEEHDVDGDGTLTKQEVMQALNSMGAVLSFQKAHYGVSHADKDGDGKIALEDAEMEKLVDYIMRFQARGPQAGSTETT